MLHPSLSLHKTHMEFHVHRFGSSMKTRRARAPLLVLPSGPFHFRPWCLPFKTAQVRRLRECGVARTTAGRGELGAGLGLLCTRAGPPGSRTPAEAQAPRDCHLEQPARGAPPEDIFHSLIHIHSFTHSHSSLGAVAAPETGRPCRSSRCTPTQATEIDTCPRSARTVSLQVAFLIFQIMCRKVWFSK